MKKGILGLVGIAMLVNAGAEARSPMRPVLEAVTIKKIVNSGNFMPVIGPSPRPTGMTTITAQVDSGGCTSASDFDVEVTPRGDGNEIRIVRVRPDLCEMYLREGEEVQLRVPFVGFGEIYVANPLRVIDNTVH